MKLKTLAVVLTGLVGCTALYTGREISHSLDQPSQLEHIATNASPTSKQKYVSNQSVNLSPRGASVEEIQDAFSQAIENSWEEYGSQLADEIFDESQNCP